jgi:hypothetical protein
MERGRFEISMERGRTKVINSCIKCIT